MVHFKRHPFLTYAIIGLSFQIAIAALGIRYDDRGVRSIIYWVGEAFSLAFWAAGEVLFMINNQQGFRFHTGLAAILGVALCYIGDWCWVACLARLERKKNRAEVERNQ